MYVCMHVMQVSNICMHVCPHACVSISIQLHIDLSSTKTAWNYRTCRSKSKQKTKEMK
jgi:hypothetical protein